MGKILLAVAVALTIGATANAQQHETAADVEDGGRVFRSSCANCHGQDGDQVPGVDLGRGQFKRAQTDQDLIGIIQNGIPSTAMPATSFSTEQAARVVAYLRSVAASKRGGSVVGDVARGKALFDTKGSCTTCHRVGAIGSRVGPDLSGIGLVRRASELEGALVDPDADVQATNRTYRVVAKDGTVTTGRLLNLDSFSVQLLDTRERLQSFLKSDLRDHGFAPSLMPSYRTRPMNDITWGGVLTTATDVLFSGGKEGYFFALDARNGALLWKVALGGQINSGPMTYAVNGRQYVTVAAGTSLFTFALKQ